MDDVNNQTVGARLCTDSFEKEDLERLQKKLKNKYNLDTTLHTTMQNNKRIYRIYIKKENMSHFVKIIKPFLLPCMYYKIAECPPALKDV